MTIPQGFRLVIETTDSYGATGERSRWLVVGWCDFDTALRPMVLPLTRKQQCAILLPDDHWIEVSEE